VLVNEYRLEIQFKKVQKIRSVNNIPTVGSNTAEKRLRMRRNKKDGEEFKFKIINKNKAI
jgi:hypothetical protein